MFVIVSNCVVFSFLVSLQSSEDDLFESFRMYHYSYRTILGIGVDCAWARRVIQIVAINSGKEKPNKKRKHEKPLENRKACLHTQ